MYPECLLSTTKIQNNVLLTTAIIWYNYDQMQVLSWVVYICWFSIVNWILLKRYFNFCVFFSIIIIFVFSLHGRYLEVMGARKNRAHKRDTRGGTREHLPKRPTKIICRPQSNYLAAAAWSVKNIWQKTIDVTQARRAKVLYIYILGLSEVNISKVIWF